MPPSPEEFNKPRYDRGVGNIVIVKNSEMRAFTDDAIVRLEKIIKTMTDGSDERVFIPSLHMENGMWAALTEFVPSGRTYPWPGVDEKAVWEEYVAAFIASQSPDYREEDYYDRCLELATRYINTKTGEKSDIFRWARFSCMRHTYYTDTEYSSLRLNRRGNTTPDQLIDDINHPAIAEVSHAIEVLEEKAGLADYQQPDSSDGELVVPR